MIITLGEHFLATCVHVSLFLINLSSWFLLFIDFWSDGEKILIFFFTAGMLYISIYLIIHVRPDFRNIMFLPYLVLEVNY